MASSAGSTREHALQTAKTLFAELGYDQTTLDMVAAAAGISRSAIDAEFDGKVQLYLAVMVRSEEEERELHSELLDGTSVLDKASVHGLLDRYLDYFWENPANSALWIQRRMNDAADLDVEAMFGAPQSDVIVRMATDVFREDVDGELLVWTIAWAVQMFAGPAGEDLQDARRDSCPRTPGPAPLPPQIGVRGSGLGITALPKARAGAITRWPDTSVRWIARSC